MRLECSQQALAVQSTAQLIEQQLTHYRDVVVDALARKAHERIADLLQNVAYTSLLQDPEAQHALAFSFVREALLREGNSLIDFIVSHASESPYAILKYQLDERAAEAVEESCVRWSANHSNYTRLGRTHGSEMYEAAVAKSVGIPADERRLDHIPDLLRNLDNRYPSTTRATFDRVRSANYRAMEVDDVPRIVESYNARLLSFEDLQLLERKPSSRLEDESRQIEEFHARIKKGKFIKPMTEEELAHQLSPAHLEERGLEFSGRLLEDDSGKILAWLTYEHPCQLPSHTPVDRVRALLKKQRKTVEEYLTRGVTGKRMTYDDAELQKRLLEDSSKIVLFGDIRNSFGPMASARLGSLAFEEMEMRNKSIQYVTAYRLWDVLVQPRLDLMPQTRRMGLLPNHNDKSEDLFRSWGFDHNAIDFNPKGPVSLRVPPDAQPEGPTYQLLPKWGVMFGMLSNTIQLAHARWEKMQRAHGDFSRDSVPSNLRKRHGA